MTSDNSKRRRKINIYHICRTGTGSSEWDYCSHDRHHTIYGEVWTPTLFLYQLLKGNKITNLWLLGAPRIWHPKCGNNVITLWNSELCFFPNHMSKISFSVVLRWVWLGSGLGRFGRVLQLLLHRFPGKLGLLLTQVYLKEILHQK